MKSNTRTDKSFVKHMVSNILAEAKIRDCEDDVLQINALIETNTSSSIRILRDINVLKWLFGNLTFLNLPEINSNTIKLCQDIEMNWGCSVVRDKIQEDFDSRQWTTIFGETVTKELYELMGHSVELKVPKKNGLKPDVETGTHMVEAKTQTYLMTGTAAEKILGTPFKYAEVPVLYRKPLHILCLGGAERESRKYGILGKIPGRKQARKQAFIEFYQSMDIHFVAATDALLYIDNVKYKD